MPMLLRAAVIAGLALSLSMFTVGQVTAGQFEDAMSAYQKGDFARALGLFRQVASTGNATAQNLLGFMYHDGEGVPRDYVRAYMWFTLALSRFPADSQEFRDASEEMDITAAAMSADQISSARGMARKCQEQKYKDCG